MRSGARSISCQSSTRSCSRAGSTPSAAPPGWAAAERGGGGGAAARLWGAEAPPLESHLRREAPHAPGPPARAAGCCSLSTVAYEATSAARPTATSSSIHGSATRTRLRRTRSGRGRRCSHSPERPRPRASPPRSSLPSACRRSPRRRYALMRTERVALAGAWRPHWPPGHRAWIVCTFIRSVRELLSLFEPSLTLYL